MKNLITLLAVLPILLLFVAQYSVQQQNAATWRYITNVVDISKEQAKRDGYFTSQNISALKQQIAERANLEKDDIVVIATDSPKYRTNSYQTSEQIHYRIEVPVKRVMAGNRFLGISDQDNSGMLIMQNSIASELLMP